MIYYSAYSPGNRRIHGFPPELKDSAHEAIELVSERPLSDFVGGGSGLDVSVMAILKPRLEYGINCRMCGNVARTKTTQLYQGFSVDITLKQRGSTKMIKTRVVHLCKNREACRLRAAVR